MLYMCGCSYITIKNHTLPFYTIQNHIMLHTYLHPIPCSLLKPPQAYAKLHGSWEGLSGGGHVEEAETASRKPSENVGFMGFVAAL